jgi:hypothetical protein
MRPLAYPSTEFPAPPSFRFDVPINWTPMAIAGTVAAVRCEVGPASFAPNVVVTIERVSGSRNYVLSRQSDVIDSLNDIARLDELDLDIAGVAWHVWEYAFAERDAGTLVQVVAVAVAGEGKAAHAISVVGSVTGVRAEELLPVIRSIVRSVSLA